MRLNIEKIKGWWEKLVHQEATPEQIALGFALGFFISFLPVPPFQTLITILVAYSMRVNKIAAMAGLSLHMFVFPVIPFVFIAEYNVGRYCYPFEHMPDADPETFTVTSLLHRSWSYIWAYLRPTLLGSLILGIPCSTVAFYLVRCATARWQAIKRRRRSTDLPVEGNPGG